MGYFLADNDDGGRDGEDSREIAGCAGLPLRGHINSACLGVGLAVLAFALRMSNSTPCPLVQARGRWGSLVICEIAPARQADAWPFGRHFGLPISSQRMQLTPRRPFHSRRLSTQNEARPGGVREPQL